MGKRRIWRSSGLFTVAMALVVASSPVAAGGAPTGAARSCEAPAATIVGTDGSEQLVGTPGRDVIDGRGGDDVIEGLAGNDVLIGGNGNDVLRGGSGNDVLTGGNGEDTLIGDLGDDTLCGDNGRDLLLGGAGDDVADGGAGDDIVSAGYGDDAVVGSGGVDLLAGGPEADDIGAGSGDDAVDGGDGDDRLAGDNGDDRISGSGGVDAANGGQGFDRCGVEQPAQCDAPFTPGTLAVSLTSVEEAVDGAAYLVTWSATAGAGARLVELYANDLLVGFERVSGTSVQGTFVVAVSELPAGGAQMYVVVTDADAGQAGSASVAVEVPPQWTPTPPQAVLELRAPMPIGDLVRLLSDAGLTPVEYRAENVPAAPPTPDPQVLAALAADGIEPHVPPVVGILYNPKGTSILDQAEELTAYYEASGIGGPPLISTVIVEGPLTPGDLGPLGPLAVLLGNAPGQTTVAPDPSQASSPTRARPGAAREPDGETGATANVPAKSGRTAADDATTASRPSAAVAAAATSAFWPTYGRFNVATSDRERKVNACGFPGISWPACLLVRFTIVEKKAELQHQIVWTRPVLEAFNERSDAYEHNVKVTSPGRSGTRPVCNPFSADNFYVRAETSKFVRHNVPKAAQLYNDTATFQDPCSANEVTFGIVHPEKLDDDVPANRLPVFSIAQESDRNDSADRSFNLNAQSLSRDNAGCDRLPLWAKKNCIGINVDETRTAVLARTGGTQLPDVHLPTCVVWKWPPFGSETDGPELVTTCGGDRDGDGFDNQIDCAPDDPSINPGAVDIPNDGIDQNCDGRDLTVGTGVIQVTMVWNDDSDMDLHVTDPGGTRIWYAAPGPTGTGGRLDRDDNVFVCGSDREPGGVENVYWPAGTSPSRGTYTVEVVEYNRCTTPAAWTVEVRIDGQLVARRTGSQHGSFTFRY